MLLLLSILSVLFALSVKPGLFDDPYALTVADDESDPNEQRFVSMGMGAAGRVLVVVYTYRGEKIRIISVRPAEPREREEYEASL